MPRIGDIVTSLPRVSAKEIKHALDYYESKKSILSRRSECMERLQGLYDSLSDKAGNIPDEKTVEFVSIFVRTKVFCDKTLFATMPLQDKFAPTFWYALSFYEGDFRLVCFDELQHIYKNLKQAKQLVEKLNVLYAPINIKSLDKKDVKDIKDIKNGNDQVKNAGSAAGTPLSLSSVQLMSEEVITTHPSALLTPLSLSPSQKAVSPTSNSITDQAPLFFNICQDSSERSPDSKNDNAKKSTKYTSLN